MQITEEIAIGLGAAGLAAAVAVPTTIEALKRPRLEIVPSLWSPAGPVTWAFAAVQIRTRPMGAPFNRLLTRDAAQGCVVDLDFFKWGTDERVMPTVPGRWSSHPEPIRSVPSQSGSATYGGANVTVFTNVYDPTLSPREHDVPAGHAGEEVAVAILTLSGVFAFSTPSYNYPDWAVPDWELSHGTYRVVVRVHGSSVEIARAFKLEYLDEDFAKFRLHET